MQTIPLVEPESTMAATNSKVEQPSLPAIVISLGTTKFVAGFANDCQASPKLIFEPVIGRPRTDMSTPAELLVGEEALQRANGVGPPFTLFQPIHDGRVIDWVVLEMILEWIIYTKLEADPRMHPIFLIVPTLSTKTDHELLTQLVFKCFYATKVYLASREFLSLFATDQYTTGCVLHCGDSMTRVVPIHQQQPISRAILRVDVGGRDVTKNVARILKKHKIVFAAAIPQVKRDSVVRKMKESHCKVSVYNLDQPSLFRPPATSTLVFPDGGGKLTVSRKELLHCCELLFTPNESTPSNDRINTSSSSPSTSSSSSHGRRYTGIAAMIVRSIMKCPREKRPALFGNIIFSGGGTMLPGYKLRVYKEVRALVAATAATTTTGSMYVKAVAPRNRKHAAWHAAVSLVTHPDFAQRAWITKKEYQEHGPSIVHEVCGDYLLDADKDNILLSSND